MKLFLVNLGRRKTLVRITSALITGILLGAALMILFLGHQIDELTLKLQKLQTDLTDSREENENLLHQLEEKSRRQKLTVETIEPTVFFPENTFTKYEEEALRMEVEEKIKTLLQDLKGQEITTLDYHLIPQIINHRHLHIQGRTMKLQVENTIVAAKLSVYVRIIPVKDQIPDNM